MDQAFLLVRVSLVKWRYIYTLGKVSCLEWYIRISSFQGSGIESFQGSGIESFQGSGIEGFHCICDDSSGHPYMFVVC